MYKDTPVKVKIEAKGEKVVKAENLRMPSSVEVVNKEQIIATLTDKKAEFVMEALIEKGIGYQMAEERERKEREIGVIEIDSLFSPVIRVNIEIENMRVGRQTDFEKLRLTVETDGTINPEEALKRVTAVLVKQFSQLTTPQTIKEVEKGEEIGEKIFQGRRASRNGDLEPETKRAESRNIPEGNTLEMPIQKLKIPSRTMNLLVEQNFKKIGDLAVLSEEEILQIEGMGDKGLRDIKKALGNHGLVLENEEEKELEELKKK